MSNENDSKDIIDWIDDALPADKMLANTERSHLFVSWDWNEGEILLKNTSGEEIELTLRGDYHIFSLMPGKTLRIHAPETGKDPFDT